MEEDRAIADLGPDLPQDVEQAEKKPKRRFIGRKAAEANATAQSRKNDNSSASVEDSGAVQSAPRRRAPRALNNVPDDILHDAAINEAIALLPANYNFEIHKTIHRVRSSGAKKIALQMPEGLLLFATTISDILAQFCPGASTLIMGDVTYGACCIDDYTARALGCDLLIHYAHSCLIPVNITQIQTLYVFVDIQIDVPHLLATVEQNFRPGSAIALVGTIQFNATLHGAAQRLRDAGFTILIPQIAPLSKGEILGCTAPRLAPTTNADADTRSTHPPVDLLLYLGDGRFHLESAMIHNPQLPAYRYDPYARRLTHEMYDHATLRADRSRALGQARRARKWGLILGALGRQGNPATMRVIEERLRAAGITWVNLLTVGDFSGEIGFDARRRVLGAGRVSAAEYRLGICVRAPAADASQGGGCEEDGRSDPRVRNRPEQESIHCIVVSAGGHYRNLSDHLRKRTRQIADRSHFCFQLHESANAMRRKPAKSTLF
nr:diphthamide biosynthesis protein 1 [Quercus suber]